MLGIDADLILYRVGFAAQTDVYSVYLKDEQAGRLASIEGKTAVNKWLEEMGLSKDEVDLEFETVPDPVENALHSAKLMIEGIKTKLKDEDCILYLSGDNNFRHEVLPSYKAGRPPRPLLYKNIRDYMIYKHNAVVVHGQEADDALGIALTSGKIDILCSYDKDLDMIPGMHYDFIKEKQYWIEEEQGDEFYYAQLMSGDRTDNICGIRGVGVTTALKKIRAAKDLSPEQVAINAYREYWGEDWEDAWNCNEQLIWIRRE